jgi:hypothetical protein
MGNKRAHPLSFSAFIPAISLSGNVLYIDNADQGRLYSHFIDTYNK